MVIQLPRAGATRRRRPAAGRSVTGAEVPAVSGGSDPGVRVPSENLLGEGLQAAAGLTQEAGDAVLNIVQRDEGLARDADDRAFQKMLSERLREAQGSGDLSDPAFVERLGQEMAKARDDILSKHKGGRQSRATLTDRLERRYLGFTDSLAVQNIAAADQRLNESVNRRISSITQDVLIDPDVLISEDPMEAFRRFSGELDDDIDFLELRPDAARAARVAGQSQIVTSMVTQLLQNGQFDRAKQIMRSDEVGEIMSPEVQRNVVDRIVIAERELFEIGLEGRKFRATAEAIAPPGASEEKVGAIARELAGIESDNPNLKFIEAGNKVLAIDEKTGIVVNEIVPETPEEQAEREAAVAQAKLSARLNVVNSILDSVGGDPLPSASILEDPNAGTEGLPAGEEGAAGRARAARQQRTARALAFPFGEEVADTSQDAREVATLFEASRRLFLAGEDQLARSFVDRAKVLMENSPEIRRNKELDKPLSPEAAGKLGVGIGSTLRDVVGVIPPSTREVATERARGRLLVQNEEQLQFLDEGILTITTLLEEIEEDPTLVGTVGRLRATGRTALNVLSDLGLDNVVDFARDTAETGTDLGFDEINDLFDDETLSVLELLQNAIGLSLARVTVPTGRIPVDVIQRSIRDVRLASRGSEDVRVSLERVLGRLQRRSESIKRRFGIEDPNEQVQQDPNDPTGQPKPANAPTFTIDLERRVLLDEDGNVVRRLPSRTQEQE